MDRYDVGGMRNSANELQDKLKSFQTLCESCSGEIKNLNESWEDDAYQTFAAKYKQYEPTMVSMQDSLKAYIDFLNKSADAIERVVITAKNAVQ